MMMSASLIVLSLIAFASGWILTLAGALWAGHHEGNIRERDKAGMTLVFGAILIGCGIILMFIAGVAA